MRYLLVAQGLTVEAEVNPRTDEVSITKITLSDPTANIYDLLSDYRIEEIEQMVYDQATEDEEPDLEEEEE